MTQLIDHDAIGEITEIEDLRELARYMREEILRLRELVEGAYFEGRGDGLDEHGNWENSDAKWQLENTK